jgi:hypothetical protein
MGSVFSKDEDDKKCNFIEDVVLLGFPHIGKHGGNKSYDIFTEISPYVNDICNIITVVLTKPYFNFSIYANSPINIKQKIIKALIDMVSTLGIAATASQYSLSHKNELIGLIKGICLTIFSFIIPELILNPILHKIKKNYLKFIVAIVIIYLLDFTSNIIFCIFLSNYTNPSKAHGESKLTHI